MLLLHTIRIEREDAAWFAVNGVPIRYSMREHAIISGLDCHEYPSGHLKLGGTKFVDYYFGNKKKITIEDVKQKLQSMGTACNDRLKMAVLFFLGRVIRGTAKDSAALDPFILRIVDDLDVCRKFPWGRLTFEDAIKEIKHVMELLKGEVHHATGFNGFIIPLEVLAFECIPKLGKKFRISSDGASGYCPRMCKSRFTKSSMKGYPLEDIYAAVGKTKVINSVLVPTVDEETLLARIIDPEPEYHREGSTSDRWNNWLNVKQKKIWWKELYESDVAARKFTKTEDKEKVTIVEGSSSNSGLESMLKGVEERIVKAMEEGFSGINLMVETKLEAMNWTMSKLEKNQRVLKKKTKKIEDMLTSIESKGNEDEEYRQWNDFDYGRDHGKDREMAEAEKDKEKAETWKKNSEKSEEDEESSGKDEEDEEKSEKDEENSEKGEEEEEQEPEKNKENSDSVEKGEENVEESDEEDSLLRLYERVRVQAEEFWKTIDDESDAEKEAEKEAEEEGEKDGEKEAEEEGEKDGEKEVEKEVQEEKEAEKEESKGTPTSTGVIIITPRGRTKAAAARKVISTPPEIVVVTEEKTSEQEAMVTEQEAIQTEIAELAEKEAEVEAIQTEQEAIQTEIVEKEAEVNEKDAEIAEKEDQDVDEEEEKAEESDKNPDVDQDVKEEEEKAEESEDNPVESPSEKQTELAENSVEVEVKTKRKPRVKVIAVPYGIPRAERLAKMRAEDEKKKAKADGTPKKKDRPKKTDVTLKPCTPLPEEKKGEPSRWVQSPFTEGKTDELEVPKKKLKTKT
ncbi:hypothetical protein Bca4012_072680 [Brassica carinata]